MTPRQLADFLQISASTLARMLRNGKLPKPLRVGGQLRFMPGDVIEQLKKQS